MVDEAVVKSVRKYLAVLQDGGLPISFGIVYGSQARGQPRARSDIDLLVVSPRYDLPFSHKDAMVLWHVAASVDSRIEPLPCGEKQWVEDDESPIIEIGRREGEKVSL